MQFSHSIFITVRMFNDNIHNMNILPFLPLSINTKLWPSVTILVENVTVLSV